MSLADASAPLARGASRDLTNVLRRERALFWICVAAASSLMWLAPQLPMNDLAQHAGQIALWRDLLKGVSPFSDLVRINLLTPYLIGYGSALPLSFVMSTEAAIAVVLTIAFWGFIAGCIALRKETGGDARLDWLFLPCFFGFDWKWGFYTFLTAAPLLLYFLVQVLRYRRAPSRSRAGAIFALGAALLFSHGLAFLFGLYAAGVLLIGPLREPLSSRARRLWPLAALALGLAVFAFVTHDRGTATNYDGAIYGLALWLRPLAALMYIVTDNWDPDILLATLMVVALLTPFFIGSRLSRGPALALLGALALFFVAVPAEAFETGYLFARFALFFPPFIVAAFRPDAARAPDGSEIPSRLVMIACCIAIVAIDGWRVHAFAAESASFRRIEFAAAPGKRALGVSFEAASAAARMKKVYFSWYAWYQADRGGFVDYNFADLPPQVVRFRPDRRPVVDLYYVSDFRTFDWAKHHGWVYDYFIMRGAPDPIGWLKARSPGCAFEIAAADGPWTLVERTSCPLAANWALRVTKN